jgi:hypothetical protein
MRMNNEKTISYWAVNLTKIGYKSGRSRYESEFAEWKVNTGASSHHLLLPVIGTGAAFGPFETEKNALAMAASNLNEGKDFFGDNWAILVGTASENTEFFKPSVIESRVYVCSDATCDGVQRFKGSCSKCKVSGRELVPTREIRDWEGRLEARL